MCHLAKQANSLKHDTRTEGQTDTLTDGEMILYQPAYADGMNMFELRLVYLLAHKIIKKEHVGTLEI